MAYIFLSAKLIVEAISLQAYVDAKSLLIKITENNLASNTCNAVEGPPEKRKTTRIIRKNVIRFHM